MLDIVSRMATIFGVPGLVVTEPNVRRLLLADE